MFQLLIIKRMIEDVLMYPFIVLGRIIAITNPGKEYRNYYFFPFFHIGGAEKIHAQVAAATGGSDCIIYFTRRSANDGMLQAFKNSNCIIKDISRYTDNKWLYFINFIYRGIISYHINHQQKTPVVFNGQCNFGYKMSPWVEIEIPQIELIHSLNTFSYIRIPFIPFFAATVMISKIRIEDHKQLYKKYGIPEYFLRRIEYIPNAIKIPQIVIQKSKPPFRVLFSGRGGTEKRLHLVTAIAKRCNDENYNVQFEIMGDVSEVLNASDYPHIHFYGAVNDQDKINEIYSRAHMVLLTSSTEGFPLVVIEGMSLGCAIVATPVGDIPFHIKDGVNGYLFTSIADEEKIMNEGYTFISELEKNDFLSRQISQNNIQYCREHFSIEQFNERYQKLFERLKPKN
jgi:glycosyltransferase involved in cell wall biosynthesis